MYVMICKREYVTKWAKISIFLPITTFPYWYKAFLSPISFINWYSHMDVLKHKRFNKLCWNKLDEETIKVTYGISFTFLHNQRQLFSIFRQKLFYKVVLCNFFWPNWSGTFQTSQIPVKKYMEKLWPIWIFLMQKRIDNCIQKHA